jgi:hypothetical protein
VNAHDATVVVLVRSVGQDNFWDLADKLFDAIDKASGGAHDEHLSVADLKAYFRSVSRASRVSRVLRVLRAAGAAVPPTW